MNRRFAAIVIVGTAVVLGIGSAHPGPCTTAIARFEQAVGQSANNPDAGPMAPQSVGAQLDRQPTAGSIKCTKERVQATFAASLARAKRLDARGNPCTRALAAVKRM
jgi:hypothetical protein